MLHHLVHGDDQEDEIELSKQSNGDVKYTGDARVRRRRTEREKLLI